MRPRGGRIFKSRHRRAAIRSALRTSSSCLLPFPERQWRSREPRLSRLPGFKVVSGPNVSTQYQWINGRSNSSKSFTYILIPEREGQFTIEPVEVRIGDKTYKTQPLQIRVTSAPRSPQPRSLALSIRSILSRRKCPQAGPSGRGVYKGGSRSKVAYPGQQVTLTYRLYTQVGISGIQLQDSPPLSASGLKTSRSTRIPEAPAA